MSINLVEIDVGLFFCRVVGVTNMSATYKLTPSHPPKSNIIIYNGNWFYTTITTIRPVPLVRS